MCFETKINSNCRDKSKPTSNFDEELIYKRFVNFLHGGLLMTFADYALFIISHAQLGGEHVYEFLSVPVSPRQAALGGSAIGIYDGDINLSNENPALFSKASDGKLSIQYINYISDINFGYTSYAKHFENIGTIAKSGTAQFLSDMTGDKKKDSNLIGQFGVGFYSVFMVADKVSVHSRSAQSPEEEGVMWESTGEDTYQLSKIPKEDRGTKITIYLNDDNKEFSEHMRVKFLLQKYSQYINFPLILNPEEGDSEVINDSEAIWLKSKRSVKADEYKDFYKFISYQWITINIHLLGLANF